MNSNKCKAIPTKYLFKKKRTKVRIKSETSVHKLIDFNVYLSAKDFEFTRILAHPNTLEKREKKNKLE